MKNIAKIILKGNYFEQETILDVYGESRRNDNKLFDYKASVIYGKNSSGKSSICDLISKLSEGTLGENESVKFFDKNDQQITLSESDQENIYVYDENFVNDNINFKQEGLNTIVMFGEQKDLDDEINTKKDKLKGSNDKLEEKIKEITKTEQKNNLNNPSTFFENIRKTLTGDGGWADREGKQINRGSRKSNVNDEYIERLISKIKLLEETKKELPEDIINEYNNMFSIYEKINDTSEFIDLEEIKIVGIDSELKELKLLLETEFKQEGYSEREKKILKLIKEQGKSEFYNNVKRTFSDDSLRECPYCFQKLEKEYKSDIITDIENVLNEEIQNFTNSLKVKKNKIEESCDILIKNREFLTNNNNILNTLYIEYIKEYDKFTNLYSEVNSVILRKIDNPYTKIFINIDDIIDTLGRINEIVVKALLEIKLYNENIKNVKIMKEKLSLLNEKRAVFEIESDAKNYIRAKEDLKNLHIEKINIENKIKSLNDNIEQLSMQKKNVGIALSEIQKWLKYIYLDSNKITLEYNDLLSQYVIKSNGKTVKLNKLSTGEKNIISLCYFFSKLMTNKNIDNVFDAPLLIVLDDPISSFDYENKVGVYSFLRMIFSKILLANEKSKIFAFTHSIEVDYFLTKTFNDFLEEKFIIQKSLENKILSDYKVERKNQYSELLNDIYNFALSKSISLENTVGNSIRKVFEAYGTFNYKLGIEKLSTDESILEKIPEDKRSYFNNLMYRIILHGDSHLEQETKGYVEQNLFYNISIDEKQKVAKSMLVFLYILDPSHLKKHYNNNDTIISNIKKWYDELEDV